MICLRNGARLNDSEVEISNEPLKIPLEAESAIYIMHIFNQNVTCFFIFFNNC